MEATGRACANCGKEFLPSQPVFESGNLLVCAQCYRVLEPWHRRMWIEAVRITRSRTYRIVAAAVFVVVGLAAIESHLSKKWRENSRTLGIAGEQSNRPSGQHVSSPPASHGNDGIEIVNPSRLTTDEDVAAYTLAFVDVGEVRSEVTKPMVNVYKLSLRKLVGIYNQDAKAIGNMTLFCHDSLAKKGIKEDCARIMSGMRMLNARYKYAECAAAYMVLRQEPMGHDEAVSSLRALFDGLEANGDELLRKR